MIQYASTIPRAAKHLYVFIMILFEKCKGKKGLGYWVGSRHSFDLWPVVCGIVSNCVNFLKYSLKWTFPCWNDSHEHKSKRLGWNATGVNYEKLAKSWTIKCNYTINIDWPESLLYNILWSSCMLWSLIYM